MIMATDNMSNCDEGYKPEKTIHKRRSSTFQTRIIMNDQNDDDKIDEMDEKKFVSENKSKCNVQNKIETFNLTEYIEKLKNERKNWQEEYRKRKIERRTLIKKKASLEGKRQIFDINILSESERAFLLKRPNYEYTYRNNKKLLDIALKISILNQLICKLDQKFMKKMESNISKITRILIKMSKQ